ncbi:hypothetical protein EB796_024903 [Bugula neritina]|uniref:Uncharacterized protein n=1 Tax=Bugula neritina TaxID=10212 RepID=A0A7J7ITR3_BUGNE|nr:hypothetical protein EB796_024903 [Bugula neritina]
MTPAKFRLGELFGDQLCLQGQTVFIPRNPRYLDYRKYALTSSFPTNSNRVQSLLMKAATSDLRTADLAKQDVMRVVTKQKQITKLCQLFVLYHAENFKSTEMHWNGTCYGF